METTQPTFQMTATCPACRAPQTMTAVSIRGTAGLVYECNRCGQQNSPTAIEDATASISHKKITLPKMLGEIMAK